MKMLRLVGATCLIAFLLLPASASAAPRTFGVAPVKLEFTLLPGGTDDKVVYVKNQGGQPLHIDAVVNDYLITRDNRFEFFAPGHSSYSASKWIKVDKTAFDLRPGQQETVHIRVSIPRNAEIGGHYAVVLFRNSAPPGKAVALSAQIGSLALIAIGNEKDIVRDGRLSEFRVGSPLLSRDVSATPVFTDEGNVHLTVKGEVIFTDMFGREAGRVPLQPMTILPKTDREMPATWKGPWFGLMTARTVVSYGKDLSTFDTQRTAPPVRFWVISWQAVAVAVLALLALIAFEELLRRTIRARRTSRSDAAGATTAADA